MQKKIDNKQFKSNESKYVQKIWKKAKVLEQNVLFDLFFLNLFFLTFTKTKKFESCLQNTWNQW